MARVDSQCLIIQFAKAPVPGKVKTRLQPVLKQSGCLALHTLLLEHTFGNLQKGDFSLELFVTSPHPYFSELVFSAEKEIPVRIQCGADLGDRMFNAIDQGLQRYQQVVVVGSDCPAVDGEYLSQALECLDQQNDVVLGPAMDGGYALIGLARVDKRLFEGVPWGSSEVLQQTRNRLRNMGWRWGELSPVRDIDRHEDLEELRKYPQFCTFLADHRQLIEIT